MKRAEMRGFYLRVDTTLRFDISMRSAYMRIDRRAGTRGCAARNAEWFVYVRIEKVTNGEARLENRSAEGGSRTHTGVEPTGF